MNRQFVRLTFSCSWLYAVSSQNFDNFCRDQPGNGNTKRQTPLHHVPHLAPFCGYFDRKKNSHSLAAQFTEESAKLARRLTCDTQSSVICSSHTIPLIINNLNKLTAAFDFDDGRQFTVNVLILLVLHVANAKWMVRTMVVRVGGLAWPRLTVHCRVNVLWALVKETMSAAVSQIGTESEMPQQWSS